MKKASPAETPIFFQIGWTERYHWNYVGARSLVNHSGRPKKPTGNCRQKASISCMYQPKLTRYTVCLLLSICQNFSCAEISANSMQIQRKFDGSTRWRPLQLHWVRNIRKTRRLNSALISVQKSRALRLMFWTLLFHFSEPRDTFELLSFPHIQKRIYLGSLAAARFNCGIYTDDR